MTLRTDLIIDSFWLNTFCLVWQNVGMCAFHIVKLSALPYMNMFCIHFNIIGAIGILRNLGSHIPCPVTKWKMHQFVPGPPEIREHCGHAIRYENKIVCKIPLIYIVSGKNAKTISWLEYLKMIYIYLLDLIHSTDASLNALPLSHGICPPNSRGHHPWTGETHRNVTSAKVASTRHLVGTGIDSQGWKNPQHFQGRVFLLYLKSSTEK